MILPGVTCSNINTQRLRLIFLEPVLLLYMMSIWMQFNLFQPLLFQKVCMVSYGNNETFCKNYNHSSPRAHETQKYTATLMFWSNLCLSLPSIALAPFLGHFGDRFGRKFPVICPSVGALLSAVNYAVCSGFKNAPAELLLISSLLQGISGGFTCVLLAIFSWAASLSSHRGRTARFGCIEFANLLGHALAPALGGALAHYTGYPWAFALAGLLNVLQILYLVFFLQVERAPQNSDVQYTCHDICRLDFLRDIWTFVRLCVRDEKNRFSLLTASFCLLVTWFVTTGTNEIRYLFIKALNLNWDVLEYNMFAAEDAGIRGLTLVTILPVLKHVFSIRDSPIMLAGLMCKILMLAIWAAAYSSAMIFLAPLAGFLATAVSACGRSAASKCVQKQDQGEKYRSYIDGTRKLFAVLGIIENVCSLLASLIFQQVYVATLSWYPGFSFVVADIFLLFPVILLTMFLPRLLMKEETDGQTSDEEQSHKGSAEAMAPTDPLKQDDPRLS